MNDFALKSLFEKKVIISRKILSVQECTAKFYNFYEKVQESRSKDWSHYFRFFF